MRKKTEKKIFKGIFVFWTGFAGLAAAALAYYSINGFIEQGEALFLFLAAFVVMFWAIGAVFFYKTMKRQTAKLDLSEMPEVPKQIVQATILEKGGVLVGAVEYSSVMNYIIVEFADGTRHAFYNLPPKIHQSLPENESGLLTYKEGHGTNLFIRFDGIGVQPSGRSSAAHQPAQKSLVQTQRNPEKKQPAWLDLPEYFIAVFVMIFAACTMRPRIIFIGLGISVLLCVSGILRKKMQIKKSETMPDQQVTATVIEKVENGGPAIVFYFADRSTKTIPVSIPVYTALLRGDTGILTFKETNQTAVFIRFDGMISE